MARARTRSALGTARLWAEEHGIRPASEDAFRICLLAVDVQNTFCIPGFELFVGGRSGTGAVDDNRRLCEFVYRNLGVITQIVPSLDTHRAQVFHAVWLVDEKGIIRTRTRSSRRRTSSRAAGGSTRPPPSRGMSPNTQSGSSPLHAQLAQGGSTSSRSGRTTRCSAGSDTRSCRRSRRRSSSTARLQPTVLPGQGRGDAHRALLDPRPGGDQRPRRRGARRRNERLIERAARVSTPSSWQARRRATALLGRSTTCSPTTAKHGGSRSASTCWRTARRRSSFQGPSTTRTRRTPRSSASPRPGCTSSARPTRSSEWPGIGERIVDAGQVTSSSRSFAR